MASDEAWSSTENCTGSAGWMTMVSYVFAALSKSPARRDCNGVTDEDTDIELEEWIP